MVGIIKSKQNIEMIYRKRKSKFVKLFNKTPSSVICPHFYELILSNGCPYNCLYCYLKLTFRGNTEPNLFTNDWSEVEYELNNSNPGVYSTGELADSLAVVPPLLQKALEYFRNQNDKFLLLLTKSTNIKILLDSIPSQQIIISFSVNSNPSYEQFEKGTPHPLERLRYAKKLIDKGWRVRIRIDPIILETGIRNYADICKKVSEIGPEMVTIGTLRQYPGLFNFSKKAPRKFLKKHPDGRMRYPINDRLEAYESFKKWLGFQPSLCKETKDLWSLLKWKFKGCNCTNGRQN